MANLRDQLQTTLGTAYTLERKVVVKVLTSELAAGLSAERFEREIGVAAQSPHLSGWHR